MVIYHISYTMVMGFPMVNTNPYGKAHDHSQAWWLPAAAPRGNGRAFGGSACGRGWGWGLQLELLDGELPTNRKWISSPQFFQWIKPTKSHVNHWGYKPLTKWDEPRATKYNQSLAF